MNRVAARVVKLMLFGPARPWWVVYAAACAGIVGCVAATGKGPLLLLSMVAFTGVSMWWCAARVWEWQYWNSIARDRGRDKCLACGYAMAGFHSTVCPECGTDLVEYQARARRLVGDHDVRGDAGTET